MGINVMFGIALLALFVILLWKFSDYYSSRRLNRWAAEHNFKLIEFKGAKFYEGTKAWRRTESQDEYRIVIEDQHGRRQQGWICFGDAWGFRPSKVEVRWDS